MRKRVWQLAGLVLLSLAVVAFGCGKEPAGSQFAYVANAADGTISILKVNRNTGALTFLAAIQTGKVPSSATVDPAGRYLFVPNAKSNDVSVFAIHPKTGLLTLLQSVTMKSGWGPLAVLVHPSNQYAYALQGMSGGVAGFPLEAVAGIRDEMPGSPFHAPAMRFADHALFDSTGRFAYLSSRSDHMLAAFAVSPLSGAWTAVDSPAPPVGPFPGTLTMEASGRFVYVSAQNGLWIYRADRETGLLRVVEGSPFSVSGGPDLAHPSGKYLFGGTGAGVVFSYRIDENDGTLQLLGGPSTVNRPISSLAIASSGRFLYATNYESDRVYGFHVTESGGLDPVKGAPFSVINGARSAAAMPKSGEYSFEPNDATWIALTPEYP